MLIGISILGIPNAYYIRVVKWVSERARMLVARTYVNEHEKLNIILIDKLVWCDSPA